MRRLLRFVVIVALVGLVVALVARLRRREGASAPSEGSATPWTPLDATRDTQAAPTSAGSPWPPASVEPAGAESPAAWVEPDDGACPASHPVKAKLSSGIFHVESGLNYARTKADRCYASPEAAEADGLRASKN